MQKTIAETLFNLICFALPVIICLPIIPKIKKLRLGVRFGLSILLTWIVMNIFNITVYHGSRVASAIEKGNVYYDGVGMNAAILILGWIFPMFTAIPCALIIFLVTRGRKG